MRSLVLAALLVVAVGHTNKCYLDPALIYSGQIFPVPLVFLTGKDGAPTPYVAGSHEAAKTSPAVAQATAEFMAAWNYAVELARKVQATMVRPVPRGYDIVAPKETAAVKKATADFTAAWNLAAQRASAVEVGVTYGVPKPVQPTPEVQRATAEFMAAWHAAAERAAAVRAALPPSTPSYKGPRPVGPTEEVKKATAEFLKAWRAAAARVPKIQTTMYQVAHITPASTPRPTARAPQPVKFTPEVEKATAEFMVAFRKAAALAAAAPDTDVFTLPTVTYSAPVPTKAYTGPLASGIIMPSGYTQEVEQARLEFQLAFDAIAARVAAARVAAGLPPSEPEAPTKYSAPSSPGIPGAPDSVAPEAPTPGAPEAPAPGAPAGVRAPTPKYTGPKASGVITPTGHTQEVEEARLDFQKAYDEAAALAAAAPDTPVDPFAGSPEAPVSAYDAPSAPEAVIAVEYPAPGKPATPGKPAAPTPEYTGPKASGDITPSGYTEEVQKAREEFQKTYDDAVAFAEKYGSVAPRDPASPHDSAAPAVPAAPAARPARPYRVDPPHAPSGDAPVDPASPGTFIAVDYSASGKPAAPTPEYTGPKASGDITPSGYTEEVQQAREEFQKTYDDAVAFAKKYGSVAPGDPESPVPAAPVGPEPSAVPAVPAKPYRGPLASGVITPSGFTEEVQAARNEFLAAYKTIAARLPSSPSPTKYHAPGSDAPSAASPAPAAPAPGFKARPRYTGPLASGDIAPSGYTIEVEEARKEFLRVHKAAAALAARTPDSATYRSAALAAQHKDAPAPVGFTPEVAKATAEFMAAWNAAAVRVAQIEAKLVKSSSPSRAAITAPTQVGTTEEIKKATQEFMSAWYAAARRVASVQMAITYAAPSAVETTEDVQRAIAEFLAAWQAAAGRAPKIQQAVVKAASLPLGQPQQVEATQEVKKATAQFMASWNAAAARVPKIETSMYAATQPFTVSIGGTDYFLALLKAAEHKAVLPQKPVAFVPFRVDVDFANEVGTTIAYAGATASSPETVVTLKSFPLSSRLFAPVQGLPVFHDYECN